MATYIILTRNDPAQLYVASALAASYSALGDEVVLFISGSAILAFKKAPQLSDQGEGERYSRFKADYLSIISNAKSLGNLKVIACTGVMAIYGVGKDELSELVDEALDFPSLIMRTKNGDRVLVV
jgi:peroxiredoxin family protein